MSLQLVANHLAQKGRGPDSNLVHMSNKEVAGLQALAKKHGGELTVNPETGLPEAGFLDSLLPTIAGAGLTYFSGGAITPMMSAGIIGGISALDSKDLGKGLMAGLGAYGGGSMVGGLAGMGLVGEGAATATAPASEAAMQAAIDENTYKKAVGEGASKFGSMFASKPMDAITSFGGGSGLSAARTLFSAAAPAIMADQNVKTTTPAPDRGMIRPQTFSRQQIPQEYQGNIGSKERRYFNDYYTAGEPYSAANGGLVALARGGYAGATSSPVVGQGNPYYQSPEYKAYEEANSGGMGGGMVGTADRYDSPYFGTVGSGSLGRQNDRAYESYLARVAQESAPTNPPVVPPPPPPPPPPGQSVPPYGVNPQPNLGGYNRQSLFRPTAPLPANSMYGDSREAYDYLMGVSPTSGGGQPYDPNRPFPLQPSIPEQGMQPDPNKPETGKGHYEFDPITKQYKWVPDPIKPVDVAAPVFENPMQGGGGGGDSESREAQRLEREKYFDNMTDAEREAHAESLRTGVNFLGKVLNPLGFLDIFRGVPLPETTPEEDKATQDLEAMTIRDLDGNVVAYKSPTDQFAGYQPNSPVPGGVPTPTITTAPEGTLAAGPAPTGDPAQQQQAARDRAVAESNAAADRTYGNAPEGRTGRDATSGDGYGGGYGSVAAGYTGGSEAATGGLSTPYGFQRMAHGGIANLHQYNLGSYSDGGRLLKGPGDGVSDDIPATIGNGQPARLADGEFVIPARIVSELGNGSTDAGARELYKMMDRIQAGRRKTVGKDQVAKNSKSARHLPA
jgi:hypothetical protein